MPSGDMDEALVVWSALGVEESLLPLNPPPVAA